MPTDDELVRYADVALQVGLVAVDDRRLLVRAHVESVDFVRVLVRRAYELGARGSTCSGPTPVSM